MAPEVSTPSASIESGIDIASHTPVAEVPVVGRIAAGTPILAEQNIEDSFPIPTRFLGSGRNFMLVVKGESMIEAGIMDGDYILVEQQNSVRNGDIVVAMVDGFESEATVKTFYKEPPHPSPAGELHHESDHRQGCQDPGQGEGRIPVFLRTGHPGFCKQNGVLAIKADRAPAIRAECLQSKRSMAAYGGDFPQTPTAPHKIIVAAVEASRTFAKVSCYAPLFHFILLTVFLFRHPARQESVHTSGILHVSPGSSCIHMCNSMNLYR